MILRITTKKMPKNYQKDNVYVAAKKRIQDIFNTFPKVYIAFIVEEKTVP